MKKNINMNTLTKVEKEKLWVPKVIFSNTEEKMNTKRVENAFVVVSWDSNYSHSDETEKDNNHIFEGKINPLIMSRVYYEEWICRYDMRW